ncbi:MAG: hypothetical protein ABIX28_02065 [Vicinamibacterales bacterium]
MTVRTKVLAALMWLSLAAAPVAAQEVRPDFSGTWTLDLSRSIPSPLPPPESLATVIEHQDPTITSTVTQKGADGEVTSRTTITTDGQENRNTVSTTAGEVTLTSRSRWSGRTLIIATSMTIEGTPIGVTESWSLSADGREMIVSRAFSSDQGAVQQKFVFTRTGS